MKKVIIRSIIWWFVFVVSVFVFWIIVLKVRAVVSNATSGSAFTANNRNELLT